MRELRVLMLRAAVASSYLTLAVADPGSADGVTAVVYGAAVLGVAIHDLRRQADGR